ncbi:hypothetical protein BDR26DRAFT_853934 [Obelidium mucronatum]|nr:hypothetical protein BDR26DRAFT_853934 [Obelidium mucronatum]
MNTSSCNIAFHQMSANMMREYLDERRMLSIMAPHLKSFTDTCALLNLSKDYNFSIGFTAIENHLTKTDFPQTSQSVQPDSNATTCTEAFTAFSKSLIDSADSVDRLDLCRYKAPQQRMHSMVSMCGPVLDFSEGSRYWDESCRQRESLDDFMAWGVAGIVILTVFISMCNQIKNKLLMRKHSREEKETS